MFTGLYPLRHGLVTHGLKLSGEVMTLAEILKQLGYRTAGFIDHDVIGVETDLHRGFETFELHEIRAMREAGYLRELEKAQAEVAPPQ